MAHLRPLERARPPCVVPFLAQTDNNWSRIEATVLQLKAGLERSRGLVAMIDTPDILVGIDSSLAADLNTLRSAGCLLITSSRPQEAQRLFAVTPNDPRVELKRYDDSEAREAIRKVRESRLHWTEPETQGTSVYDQVSKNSDDRSLLADVLEALAA